MKINLVKFFKGLLTLLLSILIAIPLFCISVVFTPIFELVTLKWQRGLDTLGGYMSNISIVVSKLINVACCSALNTFFVNDQGYLFGDVDDTLIYVFAKNHQKYTLSFLGRVFCFIFKLISKSCLSNALDLKLMQDQDSLMRLGEDDYIIKYKEDE